MDVDRNRSYASIAALRNGPKLMMDSYKPAVEKPKVEVGKPVKAKKEKKKGFFSKVGSVLKGAADILFLDDIKTLMDPNASLLDKGLAAFSFLPIGKVVKGARLGVKAASSLSRKADDVGDAFKQVEKARDATNNGLRLDLQFFASKGKGKNNIVSKGQDNLYKREKVTRNTKQITEHRRNISVDKLENEKRKFLGDDYIEVSPGKWRNSDGSRQFRAKPNDIQGKHGNIGPHVHFEFLNKNFEVTKNVHIRLR